MDVFVIHSGSDKKVVSNKIKELKKLSHDFNPLILNDGGAFGKITASKKIKKAQLVIFLSVKILTKAHILFGRLIKQ